MYRVYKIFFVLLIVTSISGNENPYRLPTTTKPSHYKIILNIDPDQQQSFSGRVSINLFPQNSTDQIVLHSKVFAIEYISITEGSDETDLYSFHNVTGDDRDFLNIYLTKKMTLNQLYVLKISYIGKYGSSVDGLYLSTYKDADGKDKNLAVTQMAPADARKVFPCYDEPAFKSTFQMNVYAPVGYHVVSNEDVTAETELPEIEGGLILTPFKETAPMSAYLIALLVSNYTYKSNLEHGDQIYRKKYRVLARPGVEDEMNFALHFGQMAMNILENYTKVEYAFSKLDNAALPNLYYNAMENWGLIIYREPRLLYNEKTTRTRDLQATATVIAHESAHMWFGNLVTPEWWDFVWLSEGFATYFESFVTDKIAPEWRLMDQFTINNNHRAMVLDSTSSTNSMTNPLGPPEELVNNFNLIAYQKASSVIRMIQNVMGETNFQEGVVNYLKSISLGNSVPSILFDGLQKAIEGKEILPRNISMSDVFSSWSNQKGYPVITVTRTGNGEIYLTQQRYHNNITEATSEKYWVPINWAASNNITFKDTSAQVWFDPELDILKLPLILNENEWFIINKQQTGYYRVLYDTLTWNSISKALKNENFRDIHFLNRAQLIDDSMNFAQTLRVSYNVTFDLLSYLGEELDFIPWSSAYNGLKSLDTLMPAAENYDKYKKFIVYITKKAYESLGLDENENDDPITKMNRVTIGELACNAGSLDCRNRANEKLLSLMNNTTSSLEVNLKELLYCAGIRNAAEDLWDYFWSNLNTSLSSDKSLIIKGLGCSENRPILQRYLRMAVSNNTNIVEPDRTAIVQSVINSGSTGVDVVVDFFNSDFASLQLNTQTVTIITNLGNKIVTKENVDKFGEFSENSNLTPDERKATNIAMETIKKNTDWLEMTLKDIDAWLNDNA